MEGSMGSAVFILLKYLYILVSKRVTSVGLIPDWYTVFLKEILIRVYSGKKCWI